MLRPIEAEDDYDGYEYILSDARASRRTGLATMTITIQDPLERVRVWGNREIMDQEERNELVPVLTFLEELIDDALGEARESLSRSQGDEISVRIEATTVEGSARDIYINFIPMMSLTGTKILSAIEKALNSGEAIEIPFLIHLTRKSPTLVNLFHVHGKKRWSDDYEKYVKEKRGVIAIRNDGEKCFAHFVALGLSHLIAKEEIEPIVHLGLTSQSYDKFKKSCRAREECAEMIWNELHQFIDLSEMRELDLGEKVRRVYHVQVVLYSFNERNARVYPDSSQVPRFAAREPVICGLLSRCDGEQLFTHVDYVSKPTSIISNPIEQPRFCVYCYEVYRRKRICNNEDCRESTSGRCDKCHTCAGFCESCKTGSCGRFSYGTSVDSLPLPDLVPFPFRKTCSHCKCVLFSPLCEEYHAVVCEEMKSTSCMECGKASHPGLLCDEERCGMCRKKIPTADSNSHVCFMQRLKMRNNPQSHYWVYDFETLVEHVPDSNRRVLKLYLATAWPVYPHAASLFLADKYPHNVCSVPGYGLDQQVFVFWGIGDETNVKGGVYDFFKFLCEPELECGQFYAHNAGKFDAIFVERFMAKRGKIANVIRRGQKIVQLHYGDLDLTFKDSINFIPTSLRSTSAAFGIEELKKGFFPHRLMTMDYYKQAAETDFIVSKPPRDMFRHDFRNNSDGKAEQKELDLFLNQFYEDPDCPWNLKRDAIEYCISDTVLLGKVLYQFRQETKSLSDPIPRPDGIKFVSFDPLQFMTLPGAVMRFYMSQFLPEETGFVIDRYKWLSRIEQQLATLYLSHQSGLPFSIVDDECYAGKYWKAEQNRWIFFVYQDCYICGCDVCYQSHERSSRTKLSFYHSLRKAEDALLNLRKQFPGCEIKVLKEHDWIRIRATEEFQSWFNTNHFEIQRHLGCDPRDSYKGGVSECYKLFVDLPHRMQVSDFVSQYPMVLIGESYHPLTGEKRKWDMPTGVPRIVYRPQSYVFDRNILGIIKCRVLAPGQMYAPFLGFKVPSAISDAEGQFETLYGLCRQCMISRSWERCQHSDDDRSFIGTWTLGEIYFAMDHGYQVLDVIEVWEYPTRTNDLFREFIIPFMIAKTCCKKSGLVEEDQFTSRGIEVCEYIYEVTGRRLTPQDFKDAPAQRTVAKLMQNVLYGKLAQRTIWPETKLFKDSSEEDTSACLGLFYDSSVVVKYAEVLDNFTTTQGDEMIILINYEKKRACSRGDADKNDIWAAHVTAGGRQALFEGIWSLSSQDPSFPSPNYMIYCDTDSLDHIIPPKLPYRTGFRIGDLEPEVPDAYYFVGGGRKQYMYKLPDGKVVCKQKGVDIRRSMTDKFTPENMLQLIRNTKRKWDSLRELEEYDKDRTTKRMRKESDNGEDHFPQILVNENRLVTVVENKVVRNKEDRQVPKKTLFHVWALKRVVQWDSCTDSHILDTLPFGYKNNS